ncbi:MAG: spore maturation protein [Clostridia bacterium]
MNTIEMLIVPVVIAFVAVYGVAKKTDVYNALIDGATDGIKIIFNILPSMVALLSAVYMLRASGAMDILTNLISPLTNLIGIPAQCAPMGLLRPLSGSAALAAGTEVIQTYGPDSYIGRVASVMLGSSESTFYTIAIYFGAVKINKTRYAIPSALIADLAGYIGSAIAVNLFF